MGEGFDVGEDVGAVGFGEEAVVRGDDEGVVGEGELEEPGDGERKERCVNLGVGFCGEGGWEMGGRTSLATRARRCDGRL